MKFIATAVSLVIMFIWFMCMLGAVYGIGYLVKEYSLPLFFSMSLIFVDILVVLGSWYLLDKIITYIDLNWR